MTNTIPNVPRELLADLLQNYYWQLHSANALASYAGGTGADEQPADCAEELRTLLSAPSPAGVDGLAAVKVWEADADWDDHELVVRLSDAQAIIDGLRGEVARLREERDSFQRIGIRQIEHCSQLAGLLREKFPRIDPHRPLPLSEVDHCCEYVLHKDRERLHCAIDAALSAGKEGE